MDGAGAAMINHTLIRKAHSGDAGMIARIYVDSWRKTYKDILPRFYLARLTYRHAMRSVQNELMAPGHIHLIAEVPRGEATGYICGGPERSGYGVYSAEVYELYVSPFFQRQGTGSQLLSALASRLYERHFYSLIVWVLARNPNHRFYEKVGGLYLGAKAISFAGKKLQAAAYGWIDITLAMGT
jgi:GNAT superfamily N-acetyltransferase